MMMRIPKLLSVLIGLPILLNCIVAAESPTTQPATMASPDEPAANSPLRTLFAQLADPDPRIRDKAKIDLMGISSDDLPKLRQLVVDNQPISPTQSAALYDIVIQSFLAGDPYKSPSGDTDASGDVGPFFMGLFWPVSDNEQPRMGVAVDVRLPGFPGYRLLKKGDMILGVFFNPDLPMEMLPNVVTNTQSSLSGAIRKSPGSQKIVLQVLRDGELMRIPLKMAPRPLAAEASTPGSIAAFEAPRVEDAEAYWQENFQPLLDNRIDPSNIAQGP